VVGHDVLQVMPVIQSNAVRSQSVTGNEVPTDSTVGKPVVVYFSSFQSTVVTVMSF
jgi:hypothetical protein